MKKNKRVVYSCITDSYDKIRDFSEIQGVDFICFCDEKSYVLNKKNNSWKVKKIIDNSLNPKQLNRLYKIKPHLFLQEYDESIYLDGNISIKSDINSFFDNITTSPHCLGIYSHPDRDCAYKELIKLTQVGLISGKHALDWFNFFKSKKLAYNAGFFECNIILRKHNDNQCINMMNYWHELFNDWPERDQPSFALMALENKEKILDLGQANLRKGLNSYFDISLHKKKNARIPRLYRRLKSEIDGTIQKMRKSLGI
tara:strand:- start:1274 stop:2041 length:768 start_codon:yes stop_codon:yes gene_type:complete